jgi:hypothetical protein
MMTARENLLTLYRHARPAWIPVVCHVDSFSQPKRDGMPPELAQAMPPTEGSVLAMSRHLGLDVMDVVHAPCSIKRHKVREETVKQSDGWTTTFTTPHGELREVVKHPGGEGLPYCQEHFVKTAADLPAMADVFEDEEHVAEPSARDYVQQRKDLVGDQGLIRGYMPGTPLGMMVRKYCGVETIAYLWADHRQELHQLFKVMEENHLRQFHLQASLGYDILYGLDDTSTTAISPAMFEEFCLGYTDRVVDAVHEHGTLYAHHSCGLIHNLLDLYRQTRMDAVEAVYIKPIGDVTLADAKARLGPRITLMAALIELMGNTDDHEAVARGVAGMFREAAPGDNIIFELACEPNKTLAEHEFIARECRKHQRSYA